MSVLERIKKRRKHKLDLGNGDSVFIRSLTHGEVKRASAIGSEEASGGFVMGCCLLNDDGSPAFQVAEGESDIDFGNRVLADDELAGDICAEIVAMATKLLRVPSPETLVKNS